jgi:hypothetical protein
MVQENLYIKKDEAVLISKGKQFVYEVSVFCRYKGYFGIIDNKLYSCNLEIPGIVSHFFRDAHTEIVCKLFSAPLSWLLDNDYIKYVKPDKKTIIKTVKTTKNVKSKTTIGKSRSWSPNG